MRSRKPFLAAAAMGLGLLTGCVSHQVDDHSLQFNEATGSLSMRQLLLNAVRASKDYPLQFSKISVYQGQGTMGASVSASLPLRLPVDGTLSPKVDWKDGISRIDLVDLNTEEAQEALKRPLTHSGFAYHAAFSGNRSSILPQFLLLEQIALSSNLARVIDESVRCSCEAVTRKDNKCKASVIGDDASAPLRAFERKVKNDPQLSKQETRLNTSLRTLTKEGLVALTRRAPKNDRDAFDSYVKSAEQYLRLKADIEEIKKSRSTFIKDLRSKSNSVTVEMKYACASLEAIENECPGEVYPVTMDKKIVLKNDLTTECRHKVFMYGILQSRVIGLTTKAQPKQDDKPDDGNKPDRGKKAESGKASTKGPRRTQEEGGNTFNIYTVEQKDSKSLKDEVSINVLNPIFAARCLGESLCDKAPGSPTGIRGEGISPLLRSPERVVRYLGELVAVQNYGARPFKPSLLDPEREGEKFTLLTVKRGRPLPGSAAVSIRDPEGETFYIPRRSHDSPKDDLSLETLSIVTDVLNAAVSKKNFPPVATLTVASP